MSNQYDMVQRARQSAGQNHPSAPSGSIGANGGGDSSVGGFQGFVDSMGDSAYFDAFQKSGNLNNLKGSQPTVIVYPEDMHTNPENGHLVHFDIFYKKNPKMNDVTTKIENLFDTAKDKITGLFSGGGEDASSNFNIGGAAKDQVDQILGNLPSGESLVGNDSGVVKQEDTVIKDTRLGKATEESLDKVTLFMPLGLQSTDSLKYNEHDFGLIKGIMEGNLQALIPGIVDKAASFVDGLGEIASTELNSAQAMSAMTGAVRNPRKEQLFESVDFRTFDFAFNFFPKSQAESHSVMEMVKLFRFHAHPEIVPNLAFYTLPSEFQISFVDVATPTNNPLINSPNGGMANENQWINKIGRCALTGVNVIYFPQDTISTFADGAPSMVNMSLTFTEMETISRNHIKAGY